MIRKIDSLYILDTKNSTYALRVMETGHLEHLFYGAKIRLDNTDGLVEQHAFAPGNTNTYDGENASFTLEDCCLEMSSYGKGDIREPFVEIVHQDGSFTSDFLFEHAEITKGKKELKGLPGSYDEKDSVDCLSVTLKDKQYDLSLILTYYVYEDCDVITRTARLANESKDTVRIERLLSMSMDFDHANYELTTFHGAWTREMQKSTQRVVSGKYVNASYTGSSSNRANPFFMIGSVGADEDHGDCYGFNLIYSGNHMETVEVSSFSKMRVVSGINPQSFSYVLKSGELFDAPEAVMCYGDGYAKMSNQMHKFVREHIVRGAWKEKVRPVLLNSWEANYFDINERKLLGLAKAGKDVGIELFVMDDGWFGERDDDTKSLGDWTVNEKKLPGGLKRIADKVNALGLDFGIWVEPEMVNVNSKLYEEHPEWALLIPKRPHSEGRNQRILDLTREDVQKFLIDAMSQVFESANISYVKWDMNRTFTDCFSGALPAENQGEVFHRYIVGLYHVLDVLMKKFPEILFEGCAAGGNRFDLGMLCYFPQIWASDNTDAICRAEIQNNYSYGYPMSVVSAHVSSCPNHQTLRNTPLETRFNVASFGVLGYECNLCDMKKEDLEAIKAQIELYKEKREVLQFGDYYRGRSFDDPSRHPGSVLSSDNANVMEWTVVSKDQKKAVGMLLQKLVAPNTQYQYYKAKGLASDYKYHFYNRKLSYNVKNFGDLVNTVAPIHIKQDSLAHNVIAKYVKMDGETEDLYMYGDALMRAGVKLKQAFSGTGYNENVRYYQDFGSRIYFMDEMDETKE